MNDDTQPRAYEFGVRRVERPAPEVVPSQDHQHDGHEIRRVAEQLIGEFRDEGAHLSGEIRRRHLRPGVEEPDRIGRAVTRQRDQPDQREREEGDAHEFADAP
jgi:hypothetical protein